MLENKLKKKQEKVKILEEKAKQLNEQAERLSARIEQIKQGNSADSCCIAPVVSSSSSPENAFSSIAAPHGNAHLRHRFGHPSFDGHPSAPHGHRFSFWFSSSSSFCT